MSERADAPEMWHPGTAVVVEEKLSRKQAVEGWLDACYCSILEMLGGGEGVSGIVLTGPGDG